MSSHPHNTISIHALLAESDNECTSLAPKPNTFLSTLSLRRATRIKVDSYMEFIISIHALLAESDSTSFNLMIHQSKFLSTLSLRRATPSITRYFFDAMHFYPRSPCGERRRLPINDSITLQFLSTLSLRRATGRAPSPPRREFYFYPRSPCGERLL